MKDPAFLYLVVSLVTAEDIWSETEVGNNDWWKVFHSI